MLRVLKTLKFTFALLIQYKKYHETYIIQSVCALFRMSYLFTK